jgi:hypothetical protein
MKKLFLVLLISAIGPLVIAQGVFSLGPKIGFNSNTLTENIDSINAGIKNTFQIGAFVRIGSKVYLQPEVNYQLVSGTLNKSLGSIVLHQDITIKTIKVPALIGVKLIQKGPVNLRVMAGPTFTYLFDKKLDPKK